jgi:hypothetical protein
VGSYLLEGSPQQPIHLRSPSSFQGSSFIIFGRKEKYSNVNIGSRESSGSYRELKKNDKGGGSGGSVGGCISDQITRSVTIVGDINGDSYPDLLIGDPSSSMGFVYLGLKQSILTTSLTSLPLSFVITSNDENNNNNSGDFFGWASAGLKDINNDGLDDFMISAINTNIVYILFGRRSFPSNNNIVSVNRMITTEEKRMGFQIEGSANDLTFGVSVSSAGDFNRDGLTDYLISAFGLSQNNVIYVIFGRSMGGSASSSLVSDMEIDKLSLSSYYKIVAPRFSFAGLSLAGLGDINGDGYDDIIIGSIPYQGGYSTQKSFVVYGKSESTLRNTNFSLSLSTMNEREEGFIITGGGFLVAGPGDVNEDGLSDILIVDYHSWQSRGNTYLMILPTNVASPPTYSPSSVPSGAPSSQPSVLPTIVIETPTNRPSTSSPMITTAATEAPLAPGAPPTTTKPSFAPVTVTGKPSRVPTLRPSTRSPTVRPTVSPSKTPSFRPSFKPSFTPTVFPTSGKPSFQPSFRSSHFPTSSPSSAPSDPFSNPFVVFPIASNGSFLVPQGKTEVLITGTGNIVLSKNVQNNNKNNKNDDHEAKIYKIVPQKNSITITDFDRNRDLVDLTLFFSKGIRSVTDLNYRTIPLTIILSKDQKIIFSSLDDFQLLSAENFRFADTEYKRGENDRHHRLRKDSSFWISLALLIVCILFVVGLLWLPSSDKKTKQEKQKRLSDETANEEDIPGNQLDISRTGVINNDLIGSDDEDGDEEDDDDSLSSLEEDSDLKFSDEDEDLDDLEGLFHSEQDDFDVKASTSNGKSDFIGVEKDLGDSRDFNNENGDDLSLNYDDDDGDIHSEEEINDINDMQDTEKDNGTTSLVASFSVQQQQSVDRPYFPYNYAFPNNNYSYSSSDPSFPFRTGTESMFNYFNYSDHESNNYNNNNDGNHPMTNSHPFQYHSSFLSTQAMANNYQQSSWNPEFVAFPSAACANIYDINTFAGYSHLSSYSCDTIESAYYDSKAAREEQQLTEEKRK